MLTPTQRFKAATIATLGYPFMALLGRTLTWKVEGRQHLEAVEASGRQPIFAFWHGRILPATLYFQRRGIVVITSENFDGEWIARIIERFGYDTARGSTSRGGRRALLQLVKDMKAGKPAAFTLDGPRGPAKQAQPGAVWLAGATGNPLVPFHIEASHHWTARSWDQSQVPRPFATAAIVIGAPIDVPGEADEAAREQRRGDLEASLASLERRARELVLALKSAPR